MCASKIKYVQQSFRVCVCMQVNLLHINISRYIHLFIIEKYVVLY